MELREILQGSGFSFKKKYGQNFLSDGNLLAAIAEDAGVTSDTTVLEIGAGAGALTRALAERARRVVSYEIDESLRPILAVTLAGLKNAEVRFSDFEKCDFAALEEELGEYLVVANLPYYITTPVIMRFVEEGKRCRGITVMVQEEVAERLTAREGTPAYGAVTAALARRGRAQLVRRVPRTLFTPRPNVDSAVVRADFTAGGFSVADERVYRAVVRAAFSSRRKTLENNLMAAFSMTREEAKALLAEAQVSAGVRGEALSPEALGHLADLIASKKSAAK